MGNALGLSQAGATPRSWVPTSVFAVSTVCSLLLTVALGLATWVVLPMVAMGWQPTLVSSGSMEPTISPGDVVVLDDEATPDIDVGSVVLYELPGTGPVLHRVVASLPDGSYITQGDANEVPDPAAVQPAQITGVAVLNVPWVGLPSLWLERGDVVPLVVAAGVLVLCTWLAPKANDPALDPWNRQDHALPGEHLLAGRATHAVVTGDHLLPADVVAELEQHLSSAHSAVTTPEGSR